MMTYQVRPRVFRITSGEPPSFPADAEVRFHFQPLQSFGMEAGGGRTVVEGAGADIVFHTCTSERFVVLKPPLKPLDVAIERPGRLVRAEGNIISVAQRFNSHEEFAEVIEGLYFALPFLLNVSFADPPIIVLVEGRVGTCGFRWELEAWSMPFRVTTQELQEGAIMLAWERLALVGGPGPRRLVAALHYFHVACRLSRRAGIPGEFLAEVLLNLSKILEVLFPPGGDGKTRDAARAGLDKLGFTEDEIEGDYLPAMVIRNEIDVGHVYLALFTMDQLRVLHAYAERAEEAFRDLIKRVLEATAAGSFEVPAHDPGPPSQKALTIIERLKEHAGPPTPAPPVQSPDPQG